LAQQAAARQVVPAVLWAWLSERPRSAASPVRRGASARSCCRREVAEARRPAVLPGAVRSWELLCQAPAAAFHQPEEAAAQAMASPSGMKAAVEAVESSVQPVASALQGRRPVEAAGAASDAQVRPRVAAEVRPAASARQLGAAAEEAVVSAAGVQPPEVAEAEPGAVQPRAAAEAALDAAAEPRQAGAAAGLQDVEVLRPGVVAAVLPDAEAPQPAAAHPSAGPPSWRPGVLLPWPAPRQ
jgi:hypothetical protein